MKKQLIIFIVFFVLFACKTLSSSQPSQNALSATVDGVNFQIINSNNSCKLMTDKPTKKTINLKLMPPCAYHRNSENNIRVITINGCKHFLIESSKPDPQFPGDCKTQIQGVKIVDNKIVVSKHIANVATCPPFEWDEKMFIGLFE